MGALDGPLRKLASTLIATFRTGAATLVRAADASYDPRTGQEIPAAIQSFSIKITPPEKFKDSEIDNTSIRKTDLRAYIAAADLEIIPNIRTDTLTIDGVTYNVVKILAFYSGDQVCLWELQLRA